jgi:hypothetical protein
MRGALLVLGLCAFLACSGKRSERCEEVCQREADCAEELDDDEYVVSRGECVRECNDLERQPDGPELVTQHVRCVDAAKSCRAVLQCP